MGVCSVWWAERDKSKQKSEISEQGICLEFLEQIGSKRRVAPALAFYSKRSSPLRVTLGNLGISGIFSIEEVIDGR